MQKSVGNLMQVPLKDFASAKRRLYKLKKIKNYRNRIHPCVCVTKTENLVLNVLNTIEFSQNQPKQVYLKT